MKSSLSSRAPFGLLLLLLGLAGGLRIYLAWKAHVPTLDTAIVGQMAVDILHGARPAFFAGQNYMGALEAYALALVYAVVPHGRVTMTFATIAFALAWIVATFFFFRRGHGRWAALAAAVVPAFPGWPTAWYTTAPYGGYPETYFFGTILLGLALPFMDRRDFAPSLRHAVALATVAGVALWTNLQVLPYLAAAGLAGLRAWGRQPRPLRNWLPYGFVPLAGLLAFLPQRLAEASHVQAPLFAGLSLKAAVRSWRALCQNDLQKSLLWTYPPASLHVLAAVLMATLVVGGLVLLWRCRQSNSVRSATAGLVVATLAVFALTYFPHPMSGFVPRYLNAPLALLLSWNLALWASAPATWVRKTGFAAALFLAVYNGIGMLAAADAKAPEARQTRAEFAEAIQAARAGGWDALLDTGSETEGYDGARLTLVSSGQPIFASAYSDRFLKHQLAWEFGDRSGYLVRRRHLPFVEGSLAALNVSMQGLATTARFGLFDTPEVQRQQERSRMPESIADWPDSVARHPLFDHAAPTVWPEDSEAFPHVLVLRFPEPIRLVGLRAAARAPEQLPYRYVVRVQQPDGTWIAAQACDRRIAGSYLSGTRLYFRGYQPWMDIRFEPVVGTALEWTLQTGPDNPVPPQLCDLQVLEDGGTPWPDWSAVVPEILAIVEANPAAQIVAERGVLRALHRHKSPDATPARIPLPYNPRFVRTQPERFPLAEGDYLLIVEEAYREPTLAALAQAGIEVADERLVVPFRILTLKIDATAAGQVAWFGYKPIGIAPSFP